MNDLNQKLKMFLAEVQKERDQIKEIKGLRKSIYLFYLLNQPVFNQNLSTTIR
jgi:hypothetical protein